MSKRCSLLYSIPGLLSIQEPSSPIFLLIPPNRPPHLPLKLRLRPPPQLRPDLRAVQGIPPVMALPVRHKPNPALRLPQRPADQPDHLQIAPLIAAAYIVNFPCTAAMQDQIQGPAMVSHIQHGIRPQSSRPRQAPFPQRCPAPPLHRKYLPG